MDVLDSADVSKLCEQHPFIKRKYINTIKDAQDIIDNIALGSKSHLYHIPFALHRSSLTLMVLRFDRSRDYYEESKNGPLLDCIEKLLVEVITKMKNLTQDQDCNILNKLKNSVIKHVELAEENGQDCSNIKDQVMNFLTDI